MLCTVCFVLEYPNLISNIRLQMKNFGTYSLSHSLLVVFIVSAKQILDTLKLLLENVSQLHVLQNVSGITVSHKVQSLIESQY